MKHNTFRLLAAAFLAFPILVGFSGGASNSWPQPASAPNVGDSFTLQNIVRDSANANVISMDSSVQRIVQTGVSIGGFNDAILSVETLASGMKDSVYLRLLGDGDMQIYTADTTQSAFPHWLTLPFSSHTPQSFTRTTSDTNVQSYDTTTLSVTYAGTENLIIKGTTVTCDVVYLTSSDYGTYGSFGPYAYSSVTAISFSSAIGWTTHSRDVSLEPPISFQTFRESVLIDYSGGGGSGNLSVQAVQPQVPNTIVDSSSSNLAVRIFNIGTLAWTPGTPQFDNANFVYVSGGSLPIPPGGQDSILIRFTPKSVGTNVSAMSFPNSSPREVPALSLTLLGQGTQVQSGSVTVEATVPQVPSTQVGDTSAEISLELKNTGTLDWMPGTPMLNNANFTYIRGGSVSIPAGAQGSIVFRFVPSVVGANTTLVTFPNSSPSESPTLSVTLTGQGTPTQGITNVSEANGYSLSSNYPNPFNPTTVIDFVTPIPGAVRMEIFDATGHLVRTLINELMEPGPHTITIDGSTLASGVYEYRLTSGAGTLSGKMVLAK